MNRADFLQECMSEFRNAPIDVFNREFCMMCSNRECSRSWGNSSIFDARVKNWKLILFDNVPRADDPKLANQRFEPVDKIPEIVSTASFETLTPLPYEETSDTDPSMPALPTVPTPAPAPQTQEHSAPVPEAMNTPFEQPMTLGRSPVEEETEQPGNVFIFEDE